MNPSLTVAQTLRSHNNKSFSNLTTHHKVNKYENCFTIVYFPPDNIYRIKHFFLGNIVIYEARGQVILPEGRQAQGQYHLAKGFINHNIAQKEVFYSVYYTESICFLSFLFTENCIQKCKSLSLQRLVAVKVSEKRVECL